MVSFILSVHYHEFYHTLYVDHCLLLFTGYGGEFNWNKYLSENGYEAAPDNLFTKAQKK